MELVFYSLVLHVFTCHPPRSRLLTRITNAQSRAFKNFIRVLQGPLHLPGEAIVHMKQLTLFLMICHLPEDILHLHGKYVLATGQPPKKSWFSQILVLCEKYQLPHPHLLLEHPLSKDPFKKHVKQAVTKFWEDVLQQEALELLSLKMFHALSRSLSQPDYIWVTAGNNSFEVRKSCILARMMSGRYRTDYFARLWTSNKKGLCLIPGCADKIGDLQHLLIECSALSDTRTKIIEFPIKKAIMLLPLHSILKMILPSSAQAQASTWAELVIILINPATHPPHRKSMKERNSTSYRKQKLLSSMNRPQNHILT